MEHNRLYFALSLFMCVFIEHIKNYLTDTHTVQWLDNNIWCLEPNLLNLICHLLFLSEHIVYEL